MSKRRSTTPRDGVRPAVAHGEPPAVADELRVLVAVAEPAHGATDRVRLGDLVPAISAGGVAFRPWAQPRLASGGGRLAPDDLADVLWADVVWFRRFASPLLAAEDGATVPSGFPELLAALEAHPDLLAGRRVVYDLDVDLLQPRAGTLAQGAEAVRGQVERLLRIADVVVVPTPALAATLADRVPAERLRVAPSAIDAAAYPAPAPEPGRTPVVAVVDTLDGPGGIERWLPALAAARAAGPAYRLVRLADPSAPVPDGFDEVVAVPEASDEWRDALAAIAPDVVLAPSAGDAHAASVAPLPWLEAAAVGAAVVADAGTGPYAGLRDGTDAVLVASPDALPGALASLLADPSRRAALAAGAREAAAAAGFADAVAPAWVDAFRAATAVAPRSGLVPAPALRDRARRRRAALAAAGPTPWPRGRRGSRLGFAGALPDDPRTLTAAIDGACRLSPPPAEIVLAGSAAAVAAAAPVVEGAPAAGVRLRLVTVPDPATPAEALAAAVAATTADWLAFLDPTADARRTGPAQLLALAAEHDLDGVFGELAIPGPAGTAKLGGWPPSQATFHPATLLLAGEVARGGLTPACAELDDVVLDWLLALMEAGCRVGGVDTEVARFLPEPARSLRLPSIGEGVPYADGGEDRLLGIVGAAADRRSTSDELAASISDWTTRYHLSRLRGNIVASVAFPPGARVIDVGAGTGTVARKLGELGLEVTALEGSLDRARVAAVRCADLPGVRVVHSTAGDYDEPGAYDAVVVIGVLEYSGSFHGGAAGPAAFLGRVKRLLKPDGVLVLAIENRFGLKYLQGYAEDHLGRPWVGVDGYGGKHGVRTWSRKALGALIADAGLGHQRFRFPFPDYKLPTLVVDERAYAQDDAATLVDALVREPVKDQANPRTLVRDDRGAHQGFLEAGLGPDVANSFLVIASADEAALERYAPADGPLAWLFGDERASRWLRRRTLVDGEAGREVRTDDAAPVTVHTIVQRRHASEPFVVGPTLEQALKVALADDGLEGARRVLREWTACVDRDAAAPRAPHALAPDEPANPFAATGAARGLPGDMLDLGLANFVRDGDGVVRRIDHEWLLGSRLDRNLVLARALIYQARTVLEGAWPGPWAPGTTIRTVLVDLAGLAGIAVDDAFLARLTSAEEWLQARVIRGVADEARSARREVA